VHVASYIYIATVISKKYLSGSEKRKKNGIAESMWKLPKISPSNKNIYAGGPITQFVPWALPFLDKPLPSDICNVGSRAVSASVCFGGFI
jgi:hypothetical protein